MSDRYRNQRDSYSEDDYSRYGNAYGSSSQRRSTRSSSGAGAYADTERQTRRYSQSDEYATQGTDTSRRQQSARTTRQSGQYRQSAQQGQTRQSQSRNAFRDYYPEESADAYRRASYGSGQSSSRAGSHSRSAYASGASGRTVNSVSTEHKPGRSARSAAQGSYAPKRSKGKRVGLIAAIVVVVVLLAGVGAAFAYVSNISNNLHEGVTQETLDALEPAEGEKTATSLGDAPFYMLLMGVDTSANRVAYEEDSDTSRSDSMILARIDPVNKKIALISIHRDTMVDLGEYGSQKINAAFQYWGPAGAIEAVSKMAGVPISHYATIDFDGFQALVDAIGGVEVNVPMEINDPDADPNYGEGHLDAGLQTLNGTQALILCRSRHTYDEVANDGDVMRAANQRMVISAIAKKVLSSDIMTIATSVQTMSKYVTTDLELTDIVGLAQIFQGINPDADIYTAMEPTTSAYIDDVWYEYLDEAAWQEMISRMDQGLPPVNKTEVDDATGVILSTGGADAPVV